MFTSYNFKLKSKLPIMFRLFSRFNYTSILVQIAVCWILQRRRTHRAVIRSMKVFYCAHGELLIILHMQRASEPCTTSHHHQHRRDQMLWKYLSQLLRIASLYSTFGICSWRHTIHSLLWKYFLGIQPVHTWTTVTHHNGRISVQGHVNKWRIDKKSDILINGCTILCVIFSRLKEQIDRETIESKEEKAGWSFLLDFSR